jgi:hypothetical protein
MTRDEGGNLYFGGQDIYTSGNNGDYAVHKTTGNGAADTSFGTSGKATTNIASGYSKSVDVVTGIALTSAGKIIVSGYSGCENLGYGATPSYRIVTVRYSSGGVIDTTYGTSGICITGVANSSSEYGYGMVYDPLLRRITICGKTGSNTAVVRLTQ